MGEAPNPSPRALRIRVQLLVGDAIVLGPGKVAVLREIDRVGSISAAARGLGMSYRRCWMLVETMNRAFREPLVATTVGARAGAQLTELGREMARLYTSLVVGLEQGEPGAIVARIENALEPRPPSSVEPSPTRSDRNAG